MRALVGGYGPAMDGDASGIAEIEVGARSLALVAPTLAAAPSPSWVTEHPATGVVYAALEGDGAVQAFAPYGEGGLRPLGDPVAVGDAPCHIAIAPGGGSIVVACWGDGGVVRIALGDDGSLGRVGRAAAPVDPYAAPAPGAAPDAGETGETGDTDAPARAPHAHQSRTAGGGLVATDMGLDLLRRWRAGEGSMRELAPVVFPYGVGPRHSQLHPSGYLYVVTEFTKEVFVLAPDDTAGWRIVSSTPVAAGLPDADTGAEIALSARGAFVQVGVRGSNAIATLRVRGDGSELAPVALTEAGVDWPRHHLVVEDVLLVAGQRSGDVVARGIDERTGIPAPPHARVAVASPSCLVPRTRA